MCIVHVLYAKTVGVCVLIHYHNHSSNVISQYHDVIPNSVLYLNEIGAGLGLTAYFIMINSLTFHANPPSLLPSPPYPPSLLSSPHHPPSFMSSPLLPFPVSLPFSHFSTLLSTTLFPFSPSPSSLFSPLSFLPLSLYPFLPLSFLPFLLLCHCHYVLQPLLLLHIHSQFITSHLPLPCSGSCHLSGRTQQQFCFVQIIHVCACTCTCTCHTYSPHQCTQMH